MRLLPDYITQGEARVAERLVRALIAQGYVLSVFDGEEYTVKASGDWASVCRALATTDMDKLIVREAHTTEHPESGRETRRKVGTITLVWGNAPDGSELPSDWSWNDRTQAGRDFNAWMEAHAYAQEGDQ